MSILSIEQIVEASDLGQAEVEMPEWGGAVVIRGLGYSEWVDVRDASIVGGQQDERIFARLLIAASLVEPKVTPEQADLLLAKSMSAVNRLSDEILRMSGVIGGEVTEHEATFPG